MKRFLIFFGEQYYPSGGMEDFIAEADTLETSIEYVRERIKKELIEYPMYEDESDLLQYRWSHIYDCERMKIVWNSITPLTFPPPSPSVDNTRHQ